MTPTGPRCSELSADAREPLAGSAPRADIWIVVEHPAGWGDAPLARAEHGVRVLMARAGAEPTGTSLGAAPGRDRAMPAPTWAGATVSATGFRVWVAHCADRPATLRLGRVDDPAEVAGWDLAAVAAGSHRSWGQPEADPLLLVCANGRRDRCCGHDGARLADRLWTGPDAHRVLTCTHLGGHRFAPTALLLPAGVLLGRLDGGGAAQLLGDARVGRLSPGQLRGFSTLSEPAQVADAATRTFSGHDGLEPLSVDVVSTSPTRAHALVTVPPTGRRSDGAPVVVELAREPFRTVPSCGRSAEELHRWVAVSVVPGPPRQPGSAHNAEHAQG